MASDLDFYDNKAYYILFDKEDSYLSNLFCQDANGHIVWSIKGIGGQVVVRDGLCYYADIEYPFNTTKLMCCDAATGHHKRVVMTDDDDERFLTLSPLSGNTLYCTSGTWTESKTWRIEKEKATRIWPNTQLQVPLGKAPNGEECGLIVHKDTVAYKPYGKFLESWIFPSSKGEEVQWINLRSGHMVTLHEGASYLYLCAPHTKPKLLYSIPSGSLEPNPWARRLDLYLQTFYVMEVRESPYVITVLSNSAIDKKVGPLVATPAIKDLLQPLQQKLLHATSADGTKVPYLLVSAKQKKPKALKGILCYVYSAYGIKTPVNWPHMQWAPLLNHGYGVVYAYCRGGGDDTLKWTMDGKADKHIRTIEDFEAVVKAAQKNTGLTPEKTIVYGRSAGGMMMGIVTARHPYGDLMGTVFTEVPFVDTLRTQTNRTIDLTPSGMSEYGMPDKSPADFGEMLAVSPIYTLPAGGATGVRVLCRTGLLDQQVLPFEPFKWIERTRSPKSDGADNKFISYEEKETHVYKMETFLKSRGLDLAILVDWLEKNRRL